MPPKELIRPESPATSPRKSVIASASPEPLRDALGPWRPQKQREGDTRGRLCSIFFIRFPSFRCEPIGHARFSKSQKPESICRLRPSSSTTSPRIRPFFVRGSPVKYPPYLWGKKDGMVRNFTSRCRNRTVCSGRYRRTSQRYWDPGTGHRSAGPSSPAVSAAVSLFFRP